MSTNGSTAQITGPAMTDHELTDWMCWRAFVTLELRYAQVQAPGHIDMHIYRFLGGIDPSVYPNVAGAYPELAVDVLPLLTNVAQPVLAGQVVRAAAAAVIVGRLRELLGVQSRFGPPRPDCSFLGRFSRRTEAWPPSVYATLTPLDYVELWSAASGAIVVAKSVDGERAAPTPYSGDDPHLREAWRRVLLQGLPDCA